MTTRLSETFGEPGGPGIVTVMYLTGLIEGQPCPTFNLGAPGKGGPGGPPADDTDSEDRGEYADKGGAGGGRENLPIIEALQAYAETNADSPAPPIAITTPGVHDIVWPYSTPTATVVTVGPGGGGGGGMGDLLAGQDGEDGMPGAIFIIPTTVPVQRP